MMIYRVSSLKGLAPLHDGIADNDDTDADYNNSKTHNVYLHLLLSGVLYCWLYDIAII